MKNPLRYIVIIPVKIYQWMISPLLGPTCRYQPTCSHYMLQAIEEWGLIKGFYIGMKRIFRCHPWGSSGYDPVPKKNQETT